MPLQPGEVSLLTLFADVHYYFGAPASKPVHHRFDKRSYLYLYHDALNKRGRVEVANHAGTPDQDAFSGYLDIAKIEYSYKQPTLFTITVHGSLAASPASSPQNDVSQWHLPAYDLRHEAKYMYKIHTMDVYLWTVDDASLFLDSLKRAVQPNQLVISDAPANLHPEHRDSMSPVVQQLEKAAITTPYGRSDSISTTHTSHSNPAMVPANHTPVSPPSGSPAPAPGFAPMAYNPAAPAAPEPIAHREKTPPPPDAEAGIGLTAAVAHGHGNQFPGPPQGGFAPQQTSYMPGPPGMMAPVPGIQRSHTVTSITSPPGVPPPPQVPSFAGPPQATSPQDPNAHLYANSPPTPGLQGQATSPPSYNTYAPGQPQNQPTSTTQYASYPTSYTPGSTVGTPGHPHTPGFTAPVQSPSIYNPQQQLPQQQQYAYGNHDQNTVQHSIHQQVYVPEGTEKPAQAGAGQAGATGKFEQRADRLEKGVSRFLKKLDKKF